MNPLNYPPTRVWTRLGETLAVAAETGFRRAHAGLRLSSRKSYGARHPGADTPMWNVCATLLRQQLAPPGAKARLARYLGVPRQRLQNYLKARDRLPDAELTLRLLHWLGETQAGRDPSI